MAILSDGEPKQLASEQYGLDFSKHTVVSVQRDTPEGFIGLTLYPPARTGQTSQVGIFVLVKL